MFQLLTFYYLCHINPQKIMELLRYFYHPDHLDSSSWITDGSGNAIQHLHYLPFGEDWVDQRNSPWNTPYTFSGKEKDVETGYGYFGARYYDSDLGIWLFVDKMNDKYTSISTNNDSRSYGSNLILNRGKTIDAGWSGGIVITLFDVQFGYQNFSCYWFEFADDKINILGYKFTAENRNGGNGAYHQSLNRAFNFVQFPNKFGAGIYSEAWFQNFIHNYHTKNGTYKYNNQGNVNVTIN